MERLLSFCVKNTSDALVRDPRSPIRFANQISWIGIGSRSNLKNPGSVRFGTVIPWEFFEPILSLELKPFAYMHQETIKHNLCHSRPTGVQ